MALLNKNKMSGDAAIASSTTKIRGTWLQNLTRKKLFWSLSVLAVVLALAWLWVDSQTLAVVGGKRITKSDYNEIAPRLKKFYEFSENKEALKDVKLAVLNRMIEQKIVEIEAEKLNVHVDESEVEKEYKSILKDYSSEEAYRQQMASAYDWTPELTKQNIRIQKLKELLEKKLLNWRSGRFIVVQHNPSGVIEGMTRAEYKEKARKVMEKIEAEIDKKGYDNVFPRAHDDYSELKFDGSTTDPAAISVSQGHFRWEPREAAVDPTTLKKIFSTKVGDRTGSIESETFFGDFVVEDQAEGNFASWDQFIDSYPKKIYTSRIRDVASSTFKNLLAIFLPARVDATHCQSESFCKSTRITGQVQDAGGNPIGNVDIHAEVRTSYAKCPDGDHSVSPSSCKCGPQQGDFSAGQYGNFVIGSNAQDNTCFFNCLYGGLELTFSKTNYVTKTLTRENDFPFGDALNGGTVQIGPVILRMSTANIHVEARRTDNNNIIHDHVGLSGSGNLSIDGGSPTFDREHDGDIHHTYVAPGTTTADDGTPLVFDDWSGCNDGKSGQTCNFHVNAGDNWTVTVYYRPNNPQPPICSPSSQTVDVGQSVSFTATQGDGSNYTWSAPGANPSSWVASNFTTSYSNPGNYSVTVTSAGQPSNPCQVTVNPPQTQVSCSISASPSSIMPGDSSTLTWSSSGSPDSATLNPGGAVPVSGSQTVSPSSTTTYTLTITKSGTAGASCSTTITVGSPSNLGCVTSNGSSSITVSIGQSFTLTATGSNTMPPYVWLAGDASPAPSQSGPSTTFTGSYATEGPRSVNVSSNNGTLAATCTVNVSTGPTTPTLTCTPPPDTATGGTVTFRADRTDSPGTFDWSGGGTPPTGSTPSGMTSFFDTSYSTTGPHTATVSSPGAGSVGCTVNIIPPPSTPPPSGSEPAGEIQFDQGERAPIY